MHAYSSLLLAVAMILSVLLTACGSSSLTTREPVGEALRIDEASKQALKHEALADLFVYYDQGHFWIYRLKDLEPHAAPMTKHDLRIQLDIHLSRRDLVVVLASKAAQLGLSFAQEADDMRDYFTDLGFKRLSIHLASGKPSRVIYKDIRLE